MVRSISPLSRFQTFKVLSLLPLTTVRLLAAIETALTAFSWPTNVLKSSGEALGLAAIIVGRVGFGRSARAAGTE